MKLVFYLKIKYTNASANVNARNTQILVQINTQILVKMPIDKTLTLV